jgi:hypothetical protein
MTPLLRILLAPIALALPVIAMLFADAIMRGWRRIASRYAADTVIEGAARQDGMVGGTAIIQLRGLLRAAVTDDGLFLTAPAFMRFTHPPLLIPWTHIAVREEQRRLGVPILTLSIGRLHMGFITLRGGVAGEVMERIGR